MSWWRKWNGEWAAQMPIRFCSACAARIFFWDNGCAAAAVTPKLTLSFGRHSCASPVPHCIEGPAKTLLANDASHDSADISRMGRCAVSTRRICTPYRSRAIIASCMGRLGFWYNSTATTPDLAKSRYSTDGGAATECVVMLPGSTWSDQGGFDVVPFDFARRQEYVKALLERHAEKLSTHAATESQAVGDFSAFRQYFEGLLRSLPWLLRRKASALIFCVKDPEGMHYWRVDPHRRAIEVIGAPPPAAVVLEVHAAVLNDCARLKMFSVWTASKRIKIRLPAVDALRHANLWFHCSTCMRSMCCRFTRIFPCARCACGCGGGANPSRSPAFYCGGYYFGSASRSAISTRCRSRREPAARRRIKVVSLVVVEYPLIESRPATAMRAAGGRRLDAGELRIIHRFESSGG